MTNVKQYVDELIEDYVSMKAPEYVRLIDIMTDNDSWDNVDQDDYNACMNLILGSLLYEYACGITDKDKIKKSIEDTVDMIIYQDANGYTTEVIKDCLKQTNKSLELINQIDN